MTVLTNLLNGGSYNSFEKPWTQFALQSLAKIDSPSRSTAADLMTEIGNEIYALNLACLEVFFFSFFFRFDVANLLKFQDKLVNVNLVCDDVDLNRDKYRGITANIGILSKDASGIQRFPLTLVSIDPNCTTGVPGTLLFLFREKIILKFEISRQRYT